DERLRQLSAALGVERRRPNPLRPEVAVNAFVSLFGPEDLTAGLRTMVFQQFDKRLPAVLGELYEKANAILDKASFSGVAPEARRQPVRGRPAAAQPHDQQEGWVPDGGVVPHLGEGGGGGAGHARRGGHAEAGGHGGTGPGADGAAAGEGRHASPAAPAGGAGGARRPGPPAAQPHDQQEGWVPDGGVVPHLGEGGGGGAGHARRGGHAEAGGHGGTGPGADGAAADEGRHASPASPAGGAGGTSTPGLPRD